MESNIAENEADLEKPMQKELVAIAQGNRQQVGALRVVEVAFTVMPSLEGLGMVHNLVELTLLHTSLNTLKGLESAGHSLCRLTVLSGCIYEPQ